MAWLGHQAGWLEADLLRGIYSGAEVDGEEGEGGESPRTQEDSTVSDLNQSERVGDPSSELKRQGWEWGD